MSRRANVEIQTPIDVVRVEVAGASILRSRETEAWTDRPIRVQAPLRDVPIPAGLHLADENHLSSIYIDRHAGEISCIGAAIDDRASRLRA